MLQNLHVSVIIIANGLVLLHDLIGEHGLISVAFLGAVETGIALAVSKPEIIRHNGFWIKMTSVAMVGVNGIVMGPKCRTLARQRRCRGVFWQTEIVVELAVIRILRAEHRGENACVLQHDTQTLRLHAGVGMIGYVQDEEGRDAFAFGDMRDGGEVFMVLGSVAEFLPVTIGRGRKSMHAQTGFGGLDDRGHIIRVAIHRHAAEEHIEGNAFGLQAAVIGAKDDRKLRARRMAADERASDRRHTPRCAFAPSRRISPHHE